MKSVKSMINESIIIAQLSDSHLFSEKEGLHHGYNVYENLKKVLSAIYQSPEIDYIIFTGDLTQDHTNQFLNEWLHLCLRLGQVNVALQT